MPQSVEQLIARLKQERSELDATINTLEKYTNGETRIGRKKPYYSAEARKKLSDAAKKRWSKRGKNAKAA